MALRRLRSRKIRREPESALAKSIREASHKRSALLAWMPPSPFNPYPQMLYQGLKGIGVGELSIQPYDMTDVLESSMRLDLRVVFHQHWTGWVLGGETDNRKAKQRLERAVRLLDSIRSAPLVWTVHNVMPHECPFPDLEIELRNRLNRQASVIHIMNPMTARALADRYRLDDDKIVVVGHPSYIDTYPRLPKRADARRRLGLDGNGTFIALIGQVRDYKKLDLLLDALDRTQSVRLIVAGATSADATAVRQSDRAKRMERVHRIDRHLSDEELMDVLAATNAVVLPYDGILNSGVLALARTNGRAAVVADVPHLRSIAGEASTRFFQPGDVASLAVALEGHHDDATPSEDGVDAPSHFAAIIADLIQ